MYNQAIKIYEQVLGPNHITARTLRHELTDLGLPIDFYFLPDNLLKKPPRLAISILESLK